MKVTDVTRNGLASRRKIRAEECETGISIYRPYTRYGRPQRQRVSISQMAKEIFEGDDAWRNSRAVSILVGALIRRGVLTPADLSALIDDERFVVEVKTALPAP